MFSGGMSALVVVLLSAVLSPVPAPLASSQEQCAVTTTEVTWGFKESFRSYISGTIALGTWSTSGDVGYETPVFSFSGGTGSLSPERDAGEVAYQGEIRFEGHGGILSTSLANPRIVFLENREATLFFDVSGDTMDLIQVDQANIEFATIKWSRGDETLDVSSGVWQIDNATVILNLAGATAFGTYASGEILDPMNLTVSVTPDCFQQSGVPALWWALGVLGVVALGAGAFVVLSQRGSKSPEPEHQ